MTRNWGNRVRDPEPLKVAACDRLWTIHDVSAYLAVPVQTLYKWRYQGDGPPTLRVGKHLRFNPDRVRAWAEELEED